MPMTDNQLARRNERVWASEVPMILGVSPWGSAWDCWVRKMGLDERPADDTPNAKRMHIGHLMEEPLLQYASVKLESAITRNQERIHRVLPLGAHLDAILQTDGTDLEAKNIYFNNPHFDAWGEEGSDEVADDVIVQVHAQMMCLDHLVNTDHANVVANVGGDFRLYRVPRSATICEAIASAVDEFWNTNVRKRVEPCGPHSLEVARMLRREAGKAVKVDGELAFRFLQASEADKAAKAQLEQVKADILAAMGDAGVDGMFTAKMVERKGYEVKPSASRQLRYKKAK